VLEILVWRGVALRTLHFWEVIRSDDFSNYYLKKEANTKYLPVHSGPNGLHRNAAFSPLSLQKGRPAEKRRYGNEGKLRNTRNNIEKTNQFQKHTWPTSEEINEEDRAFNTFDGCHRMCNSYHECNDASGIVV